MSPSLHTLGLTLFSEYDAFLKTEIFLPAQMVDERDRSCFSYSINTEATIQYFDVFTFFRLSCTPISSGYKHAALRSVTLFRK